MPIQRAFHSVLSSSATLQRAGCDHSVRPLSVRTCTFQKHSSRLASGVPA